MTLHGDERASGLLTVVVWTVGVLLALYMFVLLYGSFLEPLADIALSIEAVHNQGYDSLVDSYLTTLALAGLLLGVGAICLAIIYAVWREKFIGRTRRRPR